MQTRSRAPGTSGRSWEGGTSLPAMTCARVSAEEAPRKGGAPVSISYRIHPRAYTSLAGVRVARPWTCSGDMYAGVPATVASCSWVVAVSVWGGAGWGESVDV